MTTRRAGRAICLCLSVALGTITFAPGCSMVRTRVGLSRFWDWLPGKSDRAKVVRCRVGPLAQPDDARSHYDLGCYYQRTGRHEEAVREMERAIAMKPDFVEARNRLGISYDRLGRFDRADRAYMGALEINPGMSYIDNNLGFSYLLQGKWETAVDAFRRAIELAGDGASSRMYNNLGLAYAMAGQYGKAAEVFRKAFGEAESHYRMARIYSLLGMTDEAKSHYAEAVKLDPSSPVYGKAVEQSQANRRFSSFVEEVRRAVGTTAHTPAQVTGIDALLAGAGIEVSNGNGVLRMAWDVGRFLKKRGFAVVRLTNADRFTYPETVIDYRGSFGAASEELARALPATPKMRQVARLGRPTVKIRMLLGKDLARERGVFMEEDR